MADVVVGDAIVDPGAVVVLFGDAAGTAAAVFGAQGFADHAVDAVVVFVEFPEAEEFGDNGALLVAGGEFGYVAWVFEHCECVKIGGRGVQESEEDIRYRAGGVCGR